MKRIVALFLALTIPCLAAYDRRLVHVLEQLRSCTLAFDEELPMIGGCAVGDAGRPHEFYLLLPYFQNVAGDEDLRAMLKDPSPVVRLMAAACILKQKDVSLSAELEPLSKDKTKLFVAPYGCSVLKQSVAEIVSDMKKDPYYFEGGKDPNQPLEPTSALAPVRGSP